MDFIRHIVKAFFVGILVFIILVIIQYVNGYTFSNLRQILVWFAFNQIYAVVLYLVNAYYFRFLLKWFPNQVFKAGNLLKGAIGGVFLTLLTLFLIRIVTETFFFTTSIRDFFEGEQISNYYVGFIISVVVTAIFYTVYYYRNKQDKKVTEQKIIAGTASAKFDALKNQLDPHFLFNSLNVLTCLIEENPEAATKFTTSLSKIYRYVLEKKNLELVTVEEEIKFAELYMSLLSVRFEDSIIFKFPEKLSNPEAKVVPLSLQLLLENAVKHNQVTPSKKLYITISERENNLVVTNNLQPKQSLKESTGLGLKNIKQRYEILTDQTVDVSENRREFSVSIPILNENIQVMGTQENYISEKKYRLAKKRVDEIKVFYLHFSIYMLFIPLFIYFNFLSRAGFPWAIFPILGWGFGVGSHAIETFRFNPFFGKKWEERKIRELMENED